jgi:uncharacterized protein YbbC (DUF1343 family)/CubicO group peptidase (beta-lactamase class C family)
VALWLLLIAVLAPSRPALAQEAPGFDALDEILRDAVAAGDVPGAVALVGRGDRILYHRAFGSRTLVPDPAPMAPDTIFDIASLTKPFGTTLAVMSLVERGAVKLDAPLGRYVKEFRRPAFAEVTIRRILTHSAGLPAIPPPGPVVPFPAYAKSLAKMKLDYPPGTAFQYSDTGFILLAEVVRRVSGDRIDRYLDRKVFAPLRLPDTSFHPPRAVLARVAPTEFHDGRLLVGEVHDARARALGGAAGHAGMFSTAMDLARICRMLLDGGTGGGKTILRPTTVRTMWTRAPDGNGTRTLGWDMASAYARPMMAFFPAGSVGHTGFTGTSVWIDPSSQAYVILLTNRVHPSGGNAVRIRDLRGRVTAAVGATLFRPLLPPPASATVVSSGASDPPGPDAARPGTSVPPSVAGVPGAPGPSSAIPPPAPIVSPVRSGLDVLVEQDFAPLRQHAVGLVTNQTGIDARGRRGIDLIAGARDVRLHAIFSPEHGITGLADASVAHSRDAATGVPIWSLYGGVRRPSAEMLRGVSLLVFDIQDVGARYYTYLTTLVYVMEEAARLRIPVMVLDRPNPITGRVVEGPLTDPDLESFTAPHEIPVRTGLTIGEFARMAATERRIPVSLTVVPVAGWTRGRWYDETGLPWANPSPNIHSLTQALLYSGVGLLEATNLSVGRGTDMPFEVVGAPWIDGEGLAAALNARNLPGVRFSGVRFTPTADVHAQVPCGGVRMTVTDRDAIRPVTVALALASELRSRHRAEFKPESIQNLLVNRSTMWAFLRGEPLARLLAWADMDRSSFLNRRASYLIYP